MINVLPANELLASFEAFCQMRCENKLCHQCHLKKFVESSPTSNESTIASPGLNEKLINAIRSTRTGEHLTGVGSQGRFARILYRQSPDFKPLPMLISTVLRLIILFPILSLIEVQTGDYKLLSDRERAEQLLSGEVIEAVKQDQKAFWDYFRPLLTDDLFAEKIFRYLSGENNDAPAAAKKARIRGV